MIGKSTPEYVFIRISIWTLRAVAPLSLTHLAASIYYGRFLLPRWLALYTATEAAFYLFVYLPRRTRMQESAVHPPIVSREERRALLFRCLSNVRDPEAISGWFFGVPLGALHRENLRDWILWALFSADRLHRSEILQQYGEEIEEYVHDFEKMVGREFPEGRNESVRSMRVTLDPVSMLHRPLVWYTIVMIVDTITTASLYHAGFSHCAAKRWFNVFPPRPLSLLARQRPLHPQLSYWFRPARQPSKRAVLFLHGLGIGLWPYLPFLRALVRAEPDVTILALEFLPISMRMTAPPLGREALVAALEAVLAAHGAEQVVVIGHSFGTVVATHVLRSARLRPRVAGVVLVDPIPFLLHLPNVAYNFVYRALRAANEWQLHYFASRDPDIARTLARHFFWNEAILFKEELGGVPTAVVVAAEDQIVHAEEVRRYLTGEERAQPVWKSEEGEMEVVWFDGLDHAVVFEREKERRMLVDLVRRYSAAPTKGEGEVADGRGTAMNGHGAHTGQPASSP